MRPCTEHLSRFKSADAKTDGWTVITFYVSEKIVRSTDFVFFLKFSSKQTKPPVRSQSGWDTLVCWSRVAPWQAPPGFPVFPWGFSWQWNPAVAGLLFQNFSFELAATFHCTILLMVSFSAKINKSDNLFRYVVCLAIHPCIRVVTALLE